MSKQKVRGLKRKTKNMIALIEYHTREFPDDFYKHYWHMHLPIAQHFIDSEKTPAGIKRLCMQALIDRAAHLIDIKPVNQQHHRVVTSISLPGLWDSQMIVFEGDHYFNRFFKRDDEYQKWIPLSEQKNIAAEGGLSIPGNMHVLGFREEIVDEDETYEGEVWFIGELV